MKMRLSHEWITGITKLMMQKTFLVSFNTNIQKWFPNEMKKTY